MPHIFLGINNGCSKYEANTVACMAAESESESVVFPGVGVDKICRLRSSGGNPFVNLVTVFSGTADQLGLNDTKFLWYITINMLYNRSLI